VKLDGQQLVLDTNVLLHWLRGQDAGTETSSALRTRRAPPAPNCPGCRKGELKSLALQFKWGESKQLALDALLRELLIADISSELVTQAYARIDFESHNAGRRILGVVCSGSASFC
jgi:hypothetical protein